MKKLTLLLAFVISCFNISAQTFNCTGNFPAAIPNSNSQIDFPLAVSGLPSHIDNAYGLAQVCISVAHPQISDLKISITSPDGTNSVLSLHNGGMNANYTSTCYDMSAVLPITQGIAPFSGSFIPVESLNKLNNNQNPNGTWMISIIDVFPLAASGNFIAGFITFSNNPPPDPQSSGLVCTTTNASGCICKIASQQDCDLLPDMIVSHHVIRDGWNESPGVIDLPNAIIDIGSGPVEMKPTGLCFCDTVSVSCATSMCPDGSPPKEQVAQRIYHKNANGTMTWSDHPAGFQSFHPAHGHVHAEELCEFSLRVATSNPDATTWPIIGVSLKQSYCMINMGTCNSQDSICMSHGVEITNAMLPNLGMGSVTGCGSQGQGLFVGNYDIYSSGFGQYINMPGICNGDYYIVTQIDPYNHFQEEDETNNWVAVPVHLTQQSGAPLNASFIYSTNNLTAAFFNYTPGVTRTWDFGDGSAIVTAAYPQHTFPAPGTYNVLLTVFNGTCASTSSQLVTVGFVDINQNQSGLFNMTVFPNPAKENVTVQYELVNQSDVSVEVVNAVGQKIKLFAESNQLPGKHIFEMNDLAAGSYFVKLTASDQVILKRFVKL